ncbi:MAG: peptidoglycan DD-metalloendopeptidase family protein [Burkholderiaceae bacterium]
MIRKNPIRFACLSMAIAAIAGCAANRSAAPVVDRNPSARTEPVKPRVTATDKRGYYTVKKGDTLYRIALEFGQNFRDLVVWNNLSSPDDIKIDQVLRVLPPESGTGQDNAQTGSIASGTGVEVRPLGGSQASSASTNKTLPRGDKRPYSDSALAEMHKQDGTVSAAPGSESARTTPSRQEERNADADEGVDWIWPAEGKIIASFDAGRKGIDIAGKLGQPVLAAGSGTVLYAGRMRGYGNLVIVKHTGNLLSAYAHGKTILVKEGQTVSKGQKIAEMGNSDTDAVKLHFEIRQQGRPVDPIKFLPSR